MTSNKLSADAGINDVTSVNERGDMPHEKINHPDSTRHVPKDQLVVGWNEIGWVQISLYPEGWNNTGDAEIVDLNPQELDLLIKTLQRAKRQAYGKGMRRFVFHEGPALKTRPLFTES